jgi:hypothetical protein
MTAVPPLIRLALLAAALALNSATPALAAPAEPPTYVDLADYPTPQANWAAFRDLRHRLENAFDDVCPDTFCEGEYSDYEPMKLRCSVELASGRVNACGWAFAASEIEVDPGNGALLHRQPTWLCRFPLGARTSVGALLASLEGPQPLFQSLPGTGQTLFDTLADCLR